MKTDIIGFAERVQSSLTRYERVSPMSPMSRCKLPNACYIFIGRTFTRGHSVNTQAKLESFELDFERSYRSIDTWNCEAHSRGTTSWSHAYKQVKREPFAGHITELEFGSLQIVLERVCNPIEYQGSPAEGKVGFVVILPSEGAAYCHGRPLDANMILKFPINYLHRTFCTGPIEAVAITVDLDSLANYVNRMTNGEIDQGCLHGGLRISDPEIVQNFIETIFDIIEHTSDAHARSEDTMWRDHNIERIHRLLLQVIKAGLSAPLNLPAPSTRAYIVDKAITFMEAHLSEKLPMSRICQAVRVSPRTLRYSFEQIVGVSPMQYMLSLRLHAVRRVLLNGGAEKSINRVAESFGFEHLSRFAQYYRESFGELPSETTAACGRSSIDSLFVTNSPSSRA